MIFPNSDTIDKSKKADRMTISILVPVLVGMVLLVGHVDPAIYETQSVTISTDAGVVTCQLYTQQQVIWDRAVSAPPGMSIETADAFCRQEGERRKG